MSKLLLWIVGVLALIWLIIMSYYNSIIWLDENLKSLDSQVKNMYERRVDLIPQVSAVVKKYMQYEKWTLVDIVKLREASDNLDKLQWMIKSWDVKSTEVSSLLASTMSQLKVTLEAYPTLKADTQFTSLFTELEWSENRIRVSIKDYNDLVAIYNMKIRWFPGSMIASIFNFKMAERINPPAGKDIKAIPDVNNLLDTTK
jgi:LemA protein